MRVGLEDSLFIGKGDKARTDTVHAVVKHEGAATVGLDLIGQGRQPGADEVLDLLAELFRRGISGLEGDERLHNLQSLGIGFAIPSEMVATVVAAAEAGQNGAGGVIRPWLGLEAQKVTSEIARSLDLGVVQGVLLASLSDASPAKEAGLRVGDVVLAVNGKRVRDPAEIKFRTATVPLGSHARFEVFRKGKTRTLEVKAIAPPEEPPRNETLLEGNNHPLAGAMVSQINPAVAFELDLNIEEGVVVTGVQRYSPAERLVRPGDIILAVNGDEIEDIDDLQDELDVSRQRTWQLVFSRNGRVRQLVVR